MEAKANNHDDKMISWFVNKFPITISMQKIDTIEEMRPSLV